MKKTLCSLILTFSILLCGCGESSKAEETYALNLNSVATEMLGGAALSEYLCNKTSQVWYNAIYDKTNTETIIFVKDADGDGNVDFNDALTNLYAFEAIVDIVDKLKENKQTVDELMKELATPPEKYATCYSTITELYKTYSTFTSLAIQPTGSYNSYTEDFKKLDSDFNSTYDLIKTQLPDVTKEG